MKFVQVSDVHFDMPFTTISQRADMGIERRLDQRRAFKKVIEFVKNNNVDFLFITGDLYEQEYIKQSTIDYINNLFKEIIDTRVLIVPGNHDPLLVNSFYNNYNWSDNVKIFSENIEKVKFGEFCIYGFGFEKYELYDSDKILNNIQLDSNKINILISHGDVYNNSKYNYISDKEVKEVTKIEKRSFYRNVKGTVISKIAETIVFSTDNILMSAFISVNTVGLYANYSMIVSNIQSIVSQLISSLSGSLGNLIHTENSSEKATIILKKYQFIVFILTLFASTGILLFSNILIIIWLGKEYLFSMNVVFVIVLSFFITLYRIPFLTFINSYGLFWEQRVKNVVEAMLNLVFSMGMLLYTNLGILSILLGTVLSSVFTVLWYEPYSVYKFGLRISPKKAIKGIVIQYSYALAVLTVIYFTITKFLMSESIYEQLVYNLSLYFGVIVITTIVFSKTKEFKYIVGLVCKIYKKIFK